MSAALRLAVAAALLALIVGASRSETVQDYWQASLYPARVGAIQIGNARFSSTSPFRHGAWTAKFGASAPVARVKVDACVRIVVDSLNCSNSVEGEKNCRMIFTVDNPACTGNCTLDIGESSYIIQCPSSLDLAR